MVVQGQLASHLFEGEDLSKGLSPFTCGFQVGERDTAISARALRFDQMQLGHTAPTLAEQDTLCTKEVPVPQSIYKLGTQLACTSVVLDVVLGDVSPLATMLSNICITEWPLMEASLHAMGEDPTPVLPSMLRWVQLQMAAYFQGVSTRCHLPLPRFEYLHDVVQQCTFHLLPPCLPPTSRPPHQLLHHARRGIHQPTQTRVHQALVVAQPNLVPATETRVSG